MPIRIVLAEDHFLLREGLRRLLEAEGDLEVVAVCEDFDALLSAVVVDQPDVVITDILCLRHTWTKASVRRSSYARHIPTSA
jgi:DNA-binding NarL/FixJ family response regulator